VFVLDKTKLFLNPRARKLMIDPATLTKQKTVKVQIYINPSAAEEYHYTC